VLGVEVLVMNDVRTNTNHELLDSFITETKVITKQNKTKQNKERVLSEGSMRPLERVCRVLFLLGSLQSSDGFSVPTLGLSSPHSRFLGRSITLVPKSQRGTSTTKGKCKTSTASLSMFLGNDGGILGVGTPELVSYPRTC
jgi:hypothetical protein